jgi:hypothetical protein
MKFTSSKQRRRFHTHGRRRSQKSERFFINLPHQNEEEDSILQ